MCYNGREITLKPKTLSKQNEFKSIGLLVLIATLLTSAGCAPGGESGSLGAAPSRSSSTPRTSWTLELQSASTHTTIGGTLTGIGRATVMFETPERAGETFEATGEWRETGGGSAAGGSAQVEITGQVSIRGQVTDGLLVFTANYHEGQCTTRLDTAVGSFTDTTCYPGLVPAPREIILKLEDGAEATSTFTDSGEGWSTEVRDTWRLGGQPRWQVDFSDYHRWTRGFSGYSHYQDPSVSAQIGAGIEVDWRVSTLVEVTGSGCTAMATVAIESVTPIVDPPGTFQVTSEVKPSDANSIRCAREGDSIRLNFPLDTDPRAAGGWGYWWKYDFALTDDALDKLRAGGVPFDLAQRIMEGFGDLRCRHSGEDLITCQKVDDPPDTAPEKSDEGPGQVPNRNDAYTIPLIEGDQSAAGIHGEKIVVDKLD